MRKVSRNSECFDWNATECRTSRRTCFFHPPPRSSTAMLNASEVIAALGLQPHPIEGGFFRETYRSPGMIPFRIFATRLSRRQGSLDRDRDLLPADQGCLFGAAPAPDRRGLPLLPGCTGPDAPDFPGRQGPGNPHRKRHSRWSTASGGRAGGSLARLTPRAGGTRLRAPRRNRSALDSTTPTTSKAGVLT